MSIKSTARFGAPSHNLRCRPNLRGEGLVTIWGGLCPAPRPQREDGAVRQRQQSWLRHSVDSRACVRACVHLGDEGGADEVGVGQDGAVGDDAHVQLAGVRQERDADRGAV